MICAVPWWEQKIDSGNIGQSKPWKTCRMCSVSDISLPLCVCFGSLGCFNSVFLRLNASFGLLENINLLDKISVSGISDFQNV